MTNHLTLFDDFERTDGSRRHAAESEFHLLNRSAWPACEKVRTALEEWFSHYPDDAKKDIQSRIREPGPNHESAMFELFLHQISLRLDLAPQVHPQLPTGGGKPDFLITDRAGNSYYVEAQVAMGAPSRVPPSDAREAEILDAIDEIVLDEPTNIILSVTTSGTLAQSQKRAPIQNEVRHWLSRIGPEEIPTDGHVSHYPPLYVCRGEWTLTLTVVGVAEFKSRTPIVVRFGGGFEDYNIDVMLKRRIAEKAGKYRPDHPLIVAIHARHGNVDRGHREDALFRAPAVVREPLGSGGVASLSRTRIPDAVWRLGSEPRYSQLHGVMFVGGFLPYGMAHTYAQTYIKPSTNATVPAELIRLGSARVQNGQVIYQNSRRLGEILGLPEDWPGPAGMPSDSPFSIGDGEGGEVLPTRTSAAPCASPRPSTGPPATAAPAAGPRSSH